MYAQHVKSYKATLVSWKDYGLTWHADPCGMAPCVLLGDSRGDRVLCFTNRVIAQLVGDSKHWELLDIDWFDILVFNNYRVFKPWSNVNPFILRNGVILFPVTDDEPQRTSPKFLISYPDHGKAGKDKKQLAIYLGRRGHALFVAHLAPFLFPF